MNGVLNVMVFAFTENPYLLQSEASEDLATETGEELLFELDI